MADQKCGCSGSKSTPKKSRGTDCGCTVNPCIECTVQNCAYHCKSEDYCSLDHIRVASHEAAPATTSCVDCRSFRPED